MFCTEKKLKNITRLSEVPEFESEWTRKRNLQRYEKLKNSLSLYYGEQVSQEWRKGIDHHVKNFEQFVCRLYEGELNTFLEEVNGNDFSNTKIWLNYLEQAQEAIHWISTLEREIKRNCVEDWNKHLIDLEEFYVKQEWEEYAFLLQAVESFNPFRNLKGPAVSVSLHTKEFPYTYKDRTAGLIYKLTPTNFISMATSDSNSHLDHLTQDKERLLSLLE